MLILQVWKTAWQMKEAGNGLLHTGDLVAFLVLLLMENTKTVSPHFFPSILVH